MRLAALQLPSLTGGLRGECDENTSLARRIWGESEASAGSGPMADDELGTSGRFRYARGVGPLRTMEHVMASLEGGCACGRIRYQISDRPILQLRCYCHDCRKASGSDHAAVLLVAADRLTLTAEPKSYSVKADSGRTMSRGFCDHCGTPLIIRRPETPLVAFVQAGSLDDPTCFRSEAEVFTKHAPARDSDSGVPRFDGPPPPEFAKPRLDAYFATRR
jgi:hypothetical protein